MKTVLLSTTTQWNLGDDIIREGVRSILKLNHPYINIIHFNRHPLMQNQKKFTVGDLDGVNDNSFRYFEGIHHPIDYVVFAGTPEWAGGRLNPIKTLIQEQEIPFSLIGVGCRKRIGSGFSELIKKYCDVAITRDEAARKSLSNHITAHHLACPSLFSMCEPDKASSLPNTESEVVSFVYQYQHEGFSNIPDALYKECLKIPDLLSQKYRVRIICHSYVDFLKACQNFPKYEVCYSSDLSDLPKYYIGEVTVSMRLHGCGLSSAMRIPSIYLPQDQRSGAADALGVVCCSTADEVASEVDTAFRNLPERQEALSELFYDMRLKYLGLVKDMML